MSPAYAPKIVITVWPGVSSSIAIRPPIGHGFMTIRTWPALPRQVPTAWAAFCPVMAMSPQPSPSKSPMSSGLPVVDVPAGES